MRRHQIKRETDLQLISDWIEPGARVLDLGCGRGILLEHLQQTKGIYGLGVDLDPAKVAGAVKRGVNVYQGDAEALMAEIPDRFFDWVVLSRMLQELPRPGQVIDAALRVGRRLAVGFVNHGYWRNRWALLRTGARVRNEVFPHAWHEALPGIPVAIHDFESFCVARGYRLPQAIYLAGDWKAPVRVLPNLRAGYAVYQVEGGAPVATARAL
jgi:methionine biosynthesis protein MetW